MALPEGLGEPVGAAELAGGLAEPDGAAEEGAAEDGAALGAAEDGAADGAALEGAGEPPPTLSEMSTPAPLQRVVVAARASVAVVSMFLDD